MTLDTSTEAWREDFNERNVRFLGYNMLKSVTYNGEPVVPVILNEVDNKGRKYFNVEKLGGTDMLYLMYRNSVPVVDRLKIAEHVIGQFQAIDQAGFVLFDRAPRNIRVLSYGEKGVSTRQIDLEEYYDKDADAIYVEDRPFIRKSVEEHIALGLNPWTESVVEMTGVIVTVLDDYGDDKLVDRFNKYESLGWGVPDPLSSQDVLKLLKDDLGSTLQIIEGKKDSSPT